MKIITFYILLILISLSYLSNLSKKIKKDIHKYKSIFEYNKSLFTNKKKDRNNSKNLPIAELFKFKSSKADSSLKNKNNSSKSTSKKFSNKSTTISELNTALHQGWLKYLEITEETQDVPQTFSKNQMFFLQNSENTGINTQAKDNIGYINIPNEDFFFFELTAGSTNSLNLLSARNPPYRKLEKTIYLSDLIPQISLTKGGVEDVGNFAEGYCFMIKFTNYNKNFIWELCAETIYEKDKWMNKLIEINSKKSSTIINGENNYNISNDNLDSMIISSTGDEILPINPIISNPTLMPIPPHVLPTQQIISSPSQGIVVQDLNSGSIVVNPHSPMPMIPTVQAIPAGYQIMGIWTPCSKPCGQGIQTRYLDCMDENICRGRKMQERLCNIQACKENIENHLTKLKKVAEGHFDIDPNKLVITSHEIFNHNIFDECKLLEGNLMMVVNNQKILSHVEVNMQTVQIFSQNNPNVPIVIPMTHLTDVRPSQSIPGCFKIIQDSGNKIALCPEHNLTPISTWIQRINEFKHNCSNKLLNKIQTDIASSIHLTQDPEAHSNRLKLMQNKVIEDEKIRTTIKEKTLELQFDDFKRQVRDLLEKEDTYESKLEQQEKERIEFEDKKMRESALKEQTMANKLLNDLQTLAHSDNSYKIKEMAIKREMKNLMNEVEQKISQKREKLINKLQRMRTLHELGEKKTAKELMDMKREMGKKLSILSKKGDPSQCFNNKNRMFIENYCTHSYTDFEMQVECKKQNQFCYMCCDSEIGALNKEYLNCCYNKCDEVENNSCFSFNEMYHVVNQQVAFLG
jgi:hypothetical protein